MSVKVENLEEKNMVKLTVECEAKDFTDAIEKVFHKNRAKLSVPGFRKGAANRKIIELHYGKTVFYEDAANELIPDAYEAAVKESGLDIVSRPEIDVVQIEEGKPFIFTASAAVKPPVTLGQYKGLEVEKTNVDVTDEEVMTEIDRTREQNSRQVTVDDRPIAKGDTANIDYVGSVDGVEFEGGKAEGHDLVIGSHSFIDGFEDQLIGHSVGDEMEVNVTFPEGYQEKTLAGKPAVFKVKVNSIQVKELPELNDEFVSDVSDFENVDEYKADVKKKLMERKEEQAKTAKEDKAVEKLIENASMDIPAAMIDTQTRQMAQEFAQNLQSQGLSVEQYFQYTGMDAKKFLDGMKPQAEKRIKTRLVLEAVAKAENIEVTEEDINKEYEDMAKRYNTEVEKVKSAFGEEDSAQMKEDIAVQKALDLVRDAAVEVPAKPAEKAE